MTILTLETLKAKNACEDQIAEFGRRFGAQVEITPDLCESVALVFDFDWAARQLLNVQAAAEYRRVRAPALAEYWRVCAQAFEEFMSVPGATLEEYERVRAQAFAEYRRVCARTFGELYQRERVPEAK